MAALPGVPGVRPHIDGRQIASSIAGLSGLLAMTQQLAAALAVIAQPVTPPPGPSPGSQEANNGLDQLAHYRAQAEAKALHAAQVLAEVQTAAAAVSQAAAAGAALIQPRGR